MTDIISKRDGRGVATLTLNRPGKHNAFDDELLSALLTELRACRDDEQVRVIVLAAAGKSFCAGADLNWMKRMAGYSAEENYRDARAMAWFYQELSTIAKPTIARVQGATFGGGLGLLAACDIVVAAEDAVFGLTEVKIGLIPAVISPYIRKAIGHRQALRYSITGERFGAEEALRLGLVHKVVAGSELDHAVEMLCRELLENGPAAMAAVKSLLYGANEDDLQKEGQFTSGCIAEVRVSPEGREGVAAFLEKKKASWRMD
ncbi:enoyl-CoA hydratase-related protein [Desulfosediminicola sp.]|uniref:enoyl-CoA hydratase-related protein n=1 Tax=Desulfosediminicola sp. TaxID=2886825 RepID=UPI003AF28968